MPQIYEKSKMFIKFWASQLCGVLVIDSFVENDEYMVEHEIK
jgi:hypothetical protein